MRPSLILRTSATPILVMAVLYSLYILLRGHNSPGGGFIGGLIAGVGILFFAISRGRQEALRQLRATPTTLCGLGVLLALASGVPALILGQGYLAHQWLFIPLGGSQIPIGTALLFDVGVYLTVIGTVCAIFLNLIRR
ncbi:MAG: MnhB domain-containing protein [Pigmentiphaga sp.]